MKNKAPGAAAAMFARASGLLSVLLLSMPSARAAVIYVNAAATGANNGTSWPDACNDLQSALAAAQSGDEIWVAAGIYKPTSGADRTISFNMKTGVGIYGGFAGSETSREQRNWSANASTLSGDLGAAGDPADNSYHVVFGADSALLDGFKVKDGSFGPRDGYGAGSAMVNDGVSPAIANCTFENNVSSGDEDRLCGGAVYNRRSAPSWTHCVFSGNSVVPDGLGGAMLNIWSSPSLTDCSFIGNAASGGGAIFNESYSSPVFTDCLFKSNSAGVGGAVNNSVYETLAEWIDCTFEDNHAMYGGGLINSNASPVRIIGCVFRRNAAVYYGGGVINNETFSGEIRDCEFTENSAGMFGGGMHYGAVSGCTFTSNTALLHGGGLDTANAFDCILSGNSAVQSGGGMYDGIADGCVFSNNSTSGIGGGKYGGSAFNSRFAGNSAETGGAFATSVLFGAIPVALDACAFERNTARLGGAVYFPDKTAPKLSRCVFSNNAAQNGGALYTDSGSSRLANCLFVGNSAESSGGAMVDRFTDLTAVNCTFFGNAAPVGAAIDTLGGYLYTVLINCILWNDAANDGLEVAGGWATFRSCLVQGSNGSGPGWNLALGSDGLGNRDADPRFDDVSRPAGPDGLWRTIDDGFRLHADSPCINAGRYDSNPPDDILGLTRLARPDLGAYEYIPEPSAAEAWTLYP